MRTDISSFLLAQNLGKKIKNGQAEVHILRDINLNIKQGETVAIVGASGSGKTTLLTLLAGLDLPTYGDVYLGGQHLNKLNDEARGSLRAHNIGFIFQSFQLLSSLTALENVTLPLELLYFPYKLAREQAIFWLEKVGLQDRMLHYPPKLSGGEQQRVAIARAFINKPKLILADEMTGNLDVETGQKVADILFSLNRDLQTTLVIVTHDAELAKRCDHQLLLKNGILAPC